MYFNVVVKWYKKKNITFQIVFHGIEFCVTKAMSAFIRIKRSLNRLPARVPDYIFIFYKEIAAIGIQRNVVIAVTCKPTQTSICKKGISAACI